MKKWFIALFSLAATAAFAWFSLEDPGFIVIGRGAWTLETSLSAFILGLVLMWLTVKLLSNFLRTLWRLPLRFFHNSAKAHESLVRGLLALIQGQWKNAEQILLKTVSPDQLSVLHYFGAAYAASQQQAPSRATEYLDKVRTLLPNKEAVAILLFEAKLRLPNALEKAQTAHSLAPKHHEVLLILLTQYVQLTDWQALLKLLPEVRKHKALPTEQVQRLENRANIALIHHTLRSNPAQINKIWSQIPKMMRLRPAVLKVYVEHLIAAGDATTAEPLLREGLKYEWNAELLNLYGALETANTSQQITYAESWLKNHKKDPALLQTLGHLCLRNRLWDKALQYLDESIKLKPNPNTYKILGDLSVQKEALAQAIEYYQRAIAS